MSQENVELALQSFDAFNRRDLDAALALVDEDMKILAGGIVMEGDYRGRAAIGRWWENVLAVIPDLTVEVVEMRDLGDLNARSRARSRPWDCYF